MKVHSMQGEIAIVTGSDSGIAQAIAIAFARAGVDVAVTHADKPHLQPFRHCSPYGHPQPDAGVLPAPSRMAKP